MLSSAAHGSAARGSTARGSTAHGSHGSTAHGSANTRLYCKEDNPLKSKQRIWGKRDKNAISNDESNSNIDDDMLKIRLQNLNTELDRLSSDKDSSIVERNRKSAFGVAFGLAFEMILGPLLGAGAGWLLDDWLDTSPFFLLCFFFMGTIAAIMNIMRTTWPTEDKDGRES